MLYGDYIANLTQLAVDICNTGTARGLDGISAELMTAHRVTPPSDEELAELLPPLRAALGAVVGEADVLKVNELLSGYPPNLHVSLHDGPEHAHLHHAHDGEAGLTWVGRSCAAALAHVACGVPDVSVGRCAAADCGRFFVDQSRNRSRKFCSNACASRTTVAAYRARKRA
ncbi:hypothetical protein Rhe02_89720 [Rhizocola hellebori]|uniref:Zinc finger CGNR domain-containing protein n=1 Tax=Rhizocola hellebori TaxID=1392758 RepID=A0A8J3QHD5_9ACTN|nr:CGNR zinc finger domain-containing protein [Rhizocola hellebori]GIH10905.1 hypothetical protein Rhe02_89720 [Rhizocola hellebori]